MWMVSGSMFRKHKLLGLPLLLMIPFLVFKIRFIQRKYKRLTIKAKRGLTSSYDSHLILLQSKEFYYKTNFTSWGRFCPKFGYDPKEWKFSIVFTNWLFPLKEYDEASHVVAYSQEAITWYHNELFYAKRPFDFDFHTQAIKKQLKTWNVERIKECDKYTRGSKKK